MDAAKVIELLDSFESYMRELDMNDEPIELSDVEPYIEAINEAIRDAAGEGE